MTLHRMEFLAVLVAVALIAVAGCRSKSAQQVYSGLVEAGYQALDDGDLPGALEAFEKMREMAPENPEPLYHMACAYGRQGEVDAALEELEKAYSMDFWYADRARQDEDLTALRDDPRFEALMKRMEERARRWDEEVSPHAYKALDPAQMPSFRSVKDLDRNYRARSGDLEASRYLYDFRRFLEEQSGLLSEWVAALKHYRAEHPGAKDLEEAAFRIVEEMNHYKNVWFLATWGDDGIAAVAAAEAYLAEYPEGAHRRQVEWRRITSRWWSRDVPENAPEGEKGEQGEDAAEGQHSYTPAQYAAFMNQLHEFHDTYPGTLEAAKALTFLTWLTWEGADQQAGDDVRALYAQLEREYQGDKTARKYYHRWLSELAVQIRGIADFNGVDTAGKRWSLETMKGKVVLIDFWATWCGPCVGEIPNLKHLYADYKDRGLEIVGVSLDGDDERAFTHWLDENEVDWPQIYDGKGWDSVLARKYEVRGIPFTVLVDPEGGIAGVGLRGEALQEKVAGLLGGTGEEGAVE